MLALPIGRTAKPLEPARRRDPRLTRA